MAVKIYCCGDIHLGRQPSRIPASLADHDVPAASLTPVAAFRRLVDLACDERPAALLLAGDVVESDAARFEAFGHLARGVDRLVQAGVEVVAVAGNHDVEALPRLARMIPGFTLLGPGGTWSGHRLAHATAPPVEILGWSFPGPEGAPDPLSTLPALSPLPPGGVRLGLLHCDLDGRQVRYAPVRSAALAAVPVDAWLLGHVHAPSLDPAAARPAGYLGSLVGLDPGEPGERGAWSLDVDDTGAVYFDRLLLAPLRWEGFELAVDEITTPAEELFPALHQRIRELHERIAPRRGETLAVGCRVRLTGRTTCGRDLRTEASRLASEQPVLPLDGIAYFVEHVAVDARPALDLDVLSRGRDPVALLAAELRALERGEVSADLLEETRRQVRGATSRTVDAELGPPPEPSDEDVRRFLVRAGYRALEELLAQRGDVA